MDRKERRKIILVDIKRQRKMISMKDRKAVFCDALGLKEKWIKCGT